MSKEELNSLITLLKDEDRKISNAAMSAILSYKKNRVKINQLLAEHQESFDPSVRRKIHQIQAIQRARRRRKRLTGRFFDRRTELLQGIADLNIIWYNEYSIHAISQKWNTFISNALKYSPKTPLLIASFMQKYNFRSEAHDSQDADSYCIFSVLEEHTGSDIVLASITLELGRIFGLLGSIIHTENSGFGVLFSGRIGKKPLKNKYFGGIILPQEGWKLYSADSGITFTTWTNDKVLRYIASIFFVDSIIFDEPRYIQIFAASLAGRNVTEPLGDILPYPYGDA